MAQLSGKRPIAFVNFSTEKLSKIVFWSFYNCFNKNISAFLCSFFNFDFFTYWSCKLVLFYQCSFIFSAVLCEFWLLHYLVKIKTWIIFFPMMLLYKLFSGPLLSCFGPSFVLCITDYFWISQHISYSQRVSFAMSIFFHLLRTLLKPQIIPELFPKSFCPCFRRILPVRFCISQMESKCSLHSVNLFVQVILLPCSIKTVAVTHFWLVIPPFLMIFSSVTFPDIKVWLLNPWKHTPSAVW